MSNCEKADNDLTLGEYAAKLFAQPNEFLEGFIDEQKVREEFIRDIGWAPPKPTLRNRLREIRRRLRGAWDVLRGNAYAEPY
jgi:hypothetical protein